MNDFHGFLSNKTVMFQRQVKKIVSAFCYQTKITQFFTRAVNNVVFTHNEKRLTSKVNHNPNFLVLIYHRVNDYKNCFSIDTVPTNLFNSQMQYLMQNFNVLLLDDILKRLKSGFNLPQRCVAITFDDGYSDNYYYALPILNKYDLPATVFLTAGCVESGASPWFDQVLYAFKNTTQQTFKLPDLKEKLFFKSKQDKNNASFKTLEDLKKLSPVDRNEQIDRLYSELKVPRRETVSKDMLKWSQVREMMAKGISFGSHTLTHPILSAVSKKEAQWEIIESKRVIEFHTNKEINLFAYPNGNANDFDDETITLLKNAGFQAALTTVAGMNYSNTDPFQWHRVRPWENDIHLYSFYLLMLYCKSAFKDCER